MTVGVDKQPTNPLTVISALIGVVEAAFAYPVTKLEGANQTIFVIFMVLFPILLLSWFFLTVWFRPGHLYSPRDYARDESFLRGIGRGPLSAIPRVAPQSVQRQLGSETTRGEDVDKLSES